MYDLKSVAKSIAVKYDFRFEDLGYAIVFIDNESGMISMQTDWGDFSYGWSQAGRGTKSLLKFLVSVDSSYLMNKFCKRNYFSVNKTKAQMIKDIDESGHFTVVELNCTLLNKEEYLEAIDQVKRADFGSVDQMYLTLEFQCPLFYNHIIKGYYENVETFMEYDPCHVRFFEDIWPIIKAEFQKEVDCEENQAVIS